MTTRILTGQQWTSEAEPELGLGRVEGVREGRVTVSFPAAGERRVYAWPGAPLARTVFGAGEMIQWAGGAGTVESVREEDGLMFYRTADQEVPEAELSGLMARRGPQERMESGQTGENADFELRREALFRRAAWQRSPVRGFMGARMQLIPHQLGIAAEVSSRLRPRVLLADEVGLGKTIEACLILHRLHLTGRADRVLIAVPEPLVHQWFVELLRRFNLRFSIFDEERCGAIEDGPGGESVNPFTDSQLVLCGLDLLTGEPRRAGQAVEAGWDLLVLDEAHRLIISSNESAATAMEVVSRLAEISPGVLLLSGTPQQAGWRGLFALLRLLDPERYADAETFHQETAGYTQIARLVEEMDRTGTVNPALLPEDARHWPETAAALAGGDPSALASLREALLDRCGIGRVMFRNVRSALGGFPGREVHPVPLPDGSGETRVRWLADFLRSHPGEKILCICRTAETAEQLKEDLLLEIQVKTGVFHEGLTLLQRDRQAAWFAEPDGAEILLCSEIGGEGRNFQFARHLVLWDLPEDPDVVEQRVGRLDRIGREGTIQLHVPYATGSAEEALFRWMTEGLGLLHEPISGASRMAEETAALRASVLAAPTPEGVRGLIEETRKVRVRISQELASGYDRLLQWHAGGGAGDTLARRLAEAGASPGAAGGKSANAGWEAWCIRLLEALGMRVEELRPRLWRFQAGSVESESLPELPVEGLTAAFDRTEALALEDTAFMSSDHPLPRGAEEQLCASSQGTAACAVVSGQNRPRLLLEVCFVLETVAPPSLQADLFLPSLPIRIVVDEKGADVSEEQALLTLKASDADTRTTGTAWSAVKQCGLPDTAAALAEPRRAAAIASALKRMERAMEASLTRLQMLARRQNRSAAPESAALQTRRTRLREALTTARLRTDSLRVLVLQR